MRRWEYVEGDSAKFWEAEADGVSVTVRYGRVGTRGRTQTKEYASGDAAREQLAKAAAEKERKGYRETAAAVPAQRAADAPGTSGGTGRGEAAETTTPAAPERPDEDTFVLPAVWRRQLIPRRGGVPRKAAAASAEAVQGIVDRIAEDAAWIEEMLSGPESEPALSEAARRHLAGTPNPLGAAVIASIVGVHPHPSTAWVDHWAQDHGLPFAARAVVDLHLVRAKWTQSWGHRNQSERTAEGVVTAPTHRYMYDAGLRGPAADRARTLLAGAAEETYQDAVRELAACRTTPRHRIVVSYLVPSEPHWVTECCASPGLVAGGDAALRSMLVSSLGSPEQADLLGEIEDIRWAVPRIATVAEGIGTAITRYLASTLKESYNNDYARMGAAALVELPTDEAFALLLEHAGNKQIRPYVLQAAQRYPVRALRLMADVTRRSRTAGSVTELLLAGHVATHRDLVETVLPELDAELAAVVDPYVHPPERVADAPLDALPEVLTEPPWTRPRTRGPAKVVKGLTASSVVPFVSWKPGEREEWAATTSRYSRCTPRGGWEQMEESLRAGRHVRSLQPAGVFVHGEVEPLRELLRQWRPEDTWDAEQALRPVAARFELDVVPALTHLASRNPAYVAPLMFPFVTVEVARLMADWLIRLKSAAGAARAWFTRHGSDAAVLLVPDAIGPAGAVRTGAEQALRLIAVGLGDAAVTEAAKGYGQDAVAAVADLLSADPLENALPAKMPAPAVWAEPGLLPQVLVRDGGALPMESTRHALTMLALSKPGDVYPGVPALLEVAEPASLAEFAWAVFEQWRLAGMPPKESWALHALGFLGDDETVRRLTPVLRNWPGEGAHHRAVEGLDVLASIGTDVALLHLHGVAQRVKFKALKVRAKVKIAEVAEGLGLTGEQLADRLVPDFGLDFDGSTVVDYGPRRFTVGFDEQLRPFVTDEDGKRRKDLPKPGARDDAELATAERKRFMALKKDVRTVAADQVRRLESAMVTGRSWTAAEFHDLFVAHPLLWHLVRRLVWLSESEGKTVAFRVAEDRTLADAEDDTFVLAEGASVRLAHPLHLGDELPVWSELFADYEILQPYPQLGRPVLSLTAEEAADHRLRRFEGAKVPTGKVLGLERFGWERGEPQDAGVERWISRQVGSGLHLVIGLDGGIAVGAIDVFPEQGLETIWLDRAPDDHWPSRAYGHTFGELDPVTASEILAELTELTAS